MIKLILITLFLLSGCSTTKPPITEYKITLKTPKSDNISARCHDKSLKVSQAFSSTSLMSQQMNYVQGEHKIYAYTQAQWNNSPNQEISSQIVTILRESKLFRNVLSSKSRSKSDLILETNIEEFVQYYNKDLSSSYSTAVISLTIIDASTNIVIASETFSAKVEAETLDASGGVKGLNIALEDILKQSLEFLNGVCK